MAYVSRWNGYEETSFIGCGVYPIKQTPKSGSNAGPAPRMDPVAPNEDGVEEEQEDILDEALQFFKPHMLFRTYKIKGAADRLTLYLTMYINQCLKRLVGVTREQAKNVLFTFANEPITAPGDASFPFTSFYPSPKDAAEVDKWKEYIRQLRLELTVRIIAAVYKFPEADNTGSKFWMTFAKQTLLQQNDKK
jgi:actin related protein 2/3 complex subunit 3